MSKLIIKKLQTIFFFQYHLKLSWLLYSDLYLIDYFYITWGNSASTSGGGRLPPFGKILECVKADFIENLLVKAINRFSNNNNNNTFYVF